MLKLTGKEPDDVLMTLFEWAARSYEIGKIMMQEAAKDLAKLQAEVDRRKKKKKRKQTAE